MRHSLLALVLVFSSCSAIAGGANVADVPRKAIQYKASLIRNARAIAGLNAPVAMFAGQLTQESAWNPEAVSKVGARGMAQFMPATATWWCERTHVTVEQCQPSNPSWAIRNLVAYDLWLSQRVRAANVCQQWAFALSAFNGGLAWVYRDQKLASGKGLDSLVWFGQVELVNAGRSPANWTENRAYPRRILYRYEAQFIAAGWGDGACHSHKQGDPT